ncbi:cytochrome P450 2K6-like [Protobothrops mucrosquamatus]|uniref:cytochrome P450 2K6-like n=1 Tax=Protobothrops mucrosquamatus TaxID=103944 RepID=UPI000775FA93|nr:cytochrome P450 2K6-like [Protobothrops mucrosquamatus]
MKALARSYLWWPGLDKDIEDQVKGCQVCQQTRSEMPQAPVHRWETTQTPWSRIHVDYAGPFQGQVFLIVVDSHSKWLEVAPVPTRTIQKLRRIFATHGLPDVIVSDNGAQFTAAEFQSFLRSNMIRHATSAPFHLASNGQAERMGMQIVPLLSSEFHDESHWEKPYEFYPEHFLDAEGKFVKRDAFMPFSAGWTPKAEDKENEVEILSTNFEKPLVFTSGLVFAHGENWKVMRRFTLSTLREYGMGRKTIEDKITEECSVLTKTMETYAGKPFDITTILTAAVSNIIISILLGKRYEYEDAKFLQLLKANSENIQLSGSPAILLYNLFPMLGFLLATPKSMIKNQSKLHDFIQTILKQYLQDLDENDQSNLIESFLVRQREENMKMKNDGYFRNENLIGLVDDLFGAGTETIANTMCWAILLMMKYPEIQSKVQEEIAKEIGDLQPTTEDRAKMPHTDAVIHEIQRFADIVPTNLPHATTMDVTFKGFFIPKGMYIIPLLTSVLHDESQWEKPHDFYPEHFLDSEGKFVKRDAFMPFSAGRRICAGENLAKMELFLFFTTSSASPQDLAIRAFMAPGSLLIPNASLV